MGGEGQAILDNLGAMGLIPSLATVWKVTRLSFVIDWFYNIGAMIENLQGSLTHDITDVEIITSDKRARNLTYYNENTSGEPVLAGLEEQRVYIRASQPGVPFIPSLRIPRQPMKYVLLGLLTLTNTKPGSQVLAFTDGLDKVTPKLAAALQRAFQKMNSRDRNNLLRLTLGKFR
jgi:hypothetical protein